MKTTYSISPGPSLRWRRWIYGDASWLDTPGKAKCIRMFLIIADVVNGGFRLDRGRV